LPECFRTAAGLYRSSANDERDCGSRSKLPRRNPEQFFIQPQKHYLLVLSYHSDGDFYTLAKSWELSNGIVKPNSKLEQLRATKGKSTLAGLPENQIAASLPAMLAVNY
jgi:hypothetical protein